MFDPDTIMKLGRSRRKSSIPVVPSKPICQMPNATTAATGAAKMGLPINHKTARAASASVSAIESLENFANQKFFFASPTLLCRKPIIRCPSTFGLHT